MHDYEKLLVWQRAMDVTERVYKLTGTFPKSEEFGLSSQMRRAAVSIPSNIAEGSKRGSAKAFREFLRIALGSTAELETQLRLAKRLKYVGEVEDVGNELAHISRMLYALIAKQALA